MGAVAAKPNNATTCGCLVLAFAIVAGVVMFSAFMLR